MKLLIHLVFPFPNIRFSTFVCAVTTPSENVVDVVLEVAALPLPLLLPIVTWAQTVARKYVIHTIVSTQPRGSSLWLFGLLLLKRSCSLPMLKESSFSAALASSVPL